MKILFSLLVLFCITFAAIAGKHMKGPVIIEVVTNHISVDDALQATKSALLKVKFITTAGGQKNGFTATRTTGAKADYYVADVVAKSENGKVKITVSFVKVGTGLLKLQKVADTVKEDLEK